MQVAVAKVRPEHDTREEEVKKSRDERLKAWVAELTKSGPIVAAPVSPLPQHGGDLDRTELFASWDSWISFLSSPPVVPSLNKVLHAIEQIALLVDIKFPVLAPDIVAAITRAQLHRQDTPVARDSLLTLKILAVTDTLQNLYSSIPEEDLGFDFKKLDLETILSSSIRDNFAFSRTSSSTIDQNPTSDSTTPTHTPIESDSFIQQQISQRTSPNDMGIGGMRVQFQSVLSLGHTEPSAKSLGTANSSGEQWEQTPQKLKPEVVPSWSAQALNVPSPVEQAAGKLYNASLVDDFWTIGELIGVGNFSYVHHCTSISDETKAAVKIICKGAPDLFTDDDICREVAAFSHLDKHESVVNCIQVMEDDRFVYIIMELLTGGQLLPRVADSSHYGQFNEIQACDIARDIVRGLAHCHAFGVAHRDVKPENILFVSQNNPTNVKLTDFGISHILKCGEEGHLEMVGTPLYVAPEVLLQKPYGCAADMWSLGVIVHILLTGFPPFDDDNIVALINKVKSGPLTFNEIEWEDVSPLAKDFVMKCLKRNPRERLTASQAMLHPWLRSTASDLERSTLEMRRVSSNSPLRTLPARQASLQSVQTNLASFVKRKDTRPQVGSSHKLSLLVSLSERKLRGAPTSDSPNRFQVENAASASSANGLNTQRKSSVTRSSFVPPRHSGKSTTSSSRHRFSHSSNHDGNKNMSSPKRKSNRRLPPPTPPLELRMSGLDHSEFRASYTPVMTELDTEKLHEMGEGGSNPVSPLPKSPNFVQATASVRKSSTSTDGPRSGRQGTRTDGEKSAGKVSASLSATTASDSRSSSEHRASAKLGGDRDRGPRKYEDNMDQSNVLLVKLDESLNARRAADAEHHNPATKQKKFLRAGNRKVKRRQSSAMNIIFRRETRASTRGDTRS